MAVIHLLSLIMAGVFSIQHWNCHSFNSNGPEYIWNLSQISEMPNIICLQETWYKTQEEHPEIQGYKIADFSVRDNTKGGGTAIYIKNNLAYITKSYKSKFETSCIEFTMNKQSITLVNLYDASKDTKNNHYQELLSQVKGNFIVCGDFNAHHRLWGSKENDTKGSELYDLLSNNNNVVILNDGSGTRQNPTNLELSCIDLSICSTNIAHQITWSVDHSSSYGSDHFVVNLCFNELPVVTENEHDFNWNYKKADWDGFASMCDQTLSLDMISDNINETCTRLTNSILDVAGKYIPVKKINNKSKKPSVPWWTEECTNIVRERNKARNRAQHTGSGQDYIIYKEKEKVCKSTIKTAQQQYWESYCQSLNSDSHIGQVWNTIKKMLGKTANLIGLPTFIENNIKYETTKEKADLMVKTFAMVSSTNNYTDSFKLRKESMEDKGYEDLLTHFKDNSHSYNEPFTLQELKDAIGETTDTSPGKDKITYTMFKKFEEKSLNILLFINRIWFLQELPSQWKHSIIIPSLKQGKDSSDPLSYRPIALTSNFVKIMEKMVNNRLRWYLEKNNLFNPNQSGFRKNRNTMEQIIRLDNDIQKAFLKKHFTVGVFIDFQKAFDMIWKYGLLHKMVLLGIRGNMLAWVNSFLSDRTIQVKINSTYSEIYVVQNGTPQGSCISPTLFNIMVNDLSECLKYSAMSQFADDSAIWLSGTNLNFIQNRIQEDLDSIYLWCEKWGFLLSPNKTVAIIFTRKRKLDNLLLKIGNSIIRVVKEVKFLGMILDDKLTWLKHIQYIEAKCSKVVNCMKLLTGTKWGANSYTLRNIYIALIRSKIDYGCELYNTASHSSKKILDKLQSQALRICTGAYKNVSTNSLQVEMGAPLLKKVVKHLSRSPI